MVDEVQVLGLGVERVKRIDCDVYHPVTDCWLKFIDQMLEKRVRNDAGRHALQAMPR